MCTPAMATLAWRRHGCNVEAAWRRLLCMQQDLAYTRRDVLLLASGTVLASWSRAYGSESDFWNKKDPAQWSSEEIDKLTSKSPWAKEVSASTEGAGRGGRMGRGGMGRVGGMGIPGVGYPAADILVAAIQGAAIQAEGTRAAGIPEAAGARATRTILAEGTPEAAGGCRFMAWCAGRAPSPSWTH